MADGTTWRNRPITLGEFLAGGGALFAVCSSAACGVASEVEAGVLESAWRASIPRLQDALRCTCGARGGTFIVVGAGQEPARPRGRVYLFHD
jgi:hypothetical protein